MAAGGIGDHAPERGSEHGDQRNDSCQKPNLTTGKTQVLVIEGQEGHQAGHRAEEEEIECFCYNHIAGSNLLQ